MSDEVLWVRVSGTNPIEPYGAMQCVGRDADGAIKVRTCTVAHLNHCLINGPFRLNGTGATARIAPGYPRWARYGHNGTIQPTVGGRIGSYAGTTLDGVRYDGTALRPNNRGFLVLAIDGTAGEGLALVRPFCF